MSARAKGSKTSRFDQFSSDVDPSPLLELPKIDYARYLIEYALEIGVSKSSGNGVALPVEWMDVKAWCDLQNVSLLPWESRTIVAISREFSTQFNESNDTNVPAPYSPTDFNRDSVNNRVKSLFKALAARNKGRKARKMALS